jgi:hypothetical protein
MWLRSCRVSSRRSSSKPFVRTSRASPVIRSGCAGLGGVPGRDAEWDAAPPALSELGGTSVVDHVGYLHHERRGYLDARGIHVSQVSESGFLRCLRHEGAEKWPKGFAAALRALDLPLFMFADRQGERHFAVTFVAVVLVDGHDRPSSRLSLGGHRALMAARPLARHYRAPLGGTWYRYSCRYSISAPRSSMATRIRSRIDSMDRRRSPLTTGRWRMLA